MICPKAADKHPCRALSCSGAWTSVRGKHVWITVAKFEVSRAQRAPSFPPGDILVYCLAPQSGKIMDRNYPDAMPLSGDSS